MPEDNIVDASKPSAGRMYDYWLGGNHNFEVDRQAADQVLKTHAIYSKVPSPATLGFARYRQWS